MLKKNELVLITHPQAKCVLVGLVTKSTAKNLSICFERDGELREFSTKPSQTPSMLTQGLAVREFDGREVPALLADEKASGSAKAKKGDIVSLTVKGKNYTGRVLSGGVMPMIICGRMLIHEKAHRLTPYAMPKAEASLEPWDISNITEHGDPDDIVMTTGTITYNGKPVIKLNNSGRGGCNTYHPTKPEYAKLIKQLEATLNTIVEEAGVGPVEAMDDWVTWQWDDRPVGGEAATFAGYLKEGKKKLLSA